MPTPEVFDGLMVADVEVPTPRCPIQKLYCSRCGKCMTKRDGTHFAGIDIHLHGETTDDAFLKKQLGKYADQDRYCFCFECWLNSLFQRKRNKRET